MILVVGATGQLGSGIVRELSRAGSPARAFVRPGAAVADLAGLEGVEIAIGDLRDGASVDRALEGVTHVVATANTVAPRRGDRRRDILDRGYAALIAGAEREGVEQFVFVSVPRTPHQEQSPELRWKRINEERLIDSGVPHTILRFPMFTEVWLALSGSSIPERGEARSTLQRPFPFTRRFRRVTGRMVEGRGRLLVSGRPDTRQAFISIHDVARITAAAVGRPAVVDRVLEIGGPEILDWHAIAEIWSRLLDRPVRVTTTPRAVFRVNQLLLRPFSADAANIMGLNAAVAEMETAWEPGPIVEELGVGPLATVEEVLRAKLAMAA